MVAFTLQWPAWIAGTEITWPTESTRMMIKRRKRKGMGRRRWKRGGERRRGEVRWGGGGQGTGREGEMEKGLSKRGITEEDTGWLPEFCCARLLERNNVLALIASQPGTYSYRIKKWEKTAANKEMELGRLANVPRFTQQADGRGSNRPLASVIQGHARGFGDRKPGLWPGRATCCLRDSEHGADSPKDRAALGCEESMEPKASPGAWHLVVLYHYIRGTHILAGETQGC